MQYFKLPIAVFVIVFFWACGNSDSWLSRQWHNTTAHYNVYFNADQKWEETVLGLREANKDDFRNYLELYNYGTAESLKGNLGTMDEVVKKVSTMIDKHPRSKWVDDAYLLMGKAYFMKGDFIAARDIFDYVISTFKDPIVTYKARLWTFQCLYYQGKFEEAESLIIGLKNDKAFPKTLEGELYKALSAIMLRNKKIGLAAEYLELALHGAKGKLEKYRLHFALAQSYQQLEKYDAAELHYAKVVRMTPPYEIAFNARINQVEILSLQKKDYSRANHLLKRMLKDDKNLEYFGQIYYRMGINEIRSGNVKQGVSLLNKSIQESKNDKAQATTSYLALGDFYYEKKIFDQSALYYDSANNLLDENHPDYASISKKSTQLSELLRHLLTIKKQDSLLRLARDPDLRERTIDKIIEQEKKQPAPKSSPDPVAPAPGNMNNTGNTSFPFYNQANRARGITEFQKKWGERANRDYWRINSKASSNASADNNSGSGLDGKSTEDTSAVIPTSDANRKKYYKEIPLTKEAQQESEKKIEEALLAAAGVYQNSFSQNENALEYYKELLRRFPQSKYKAQVLYEMAKIHRSMGNTAEFDVLKKRLETEHPESIYLKLLDDPNAAKNIAIGGSEKKEIEILYEQMYSQYEAGNYSAALATKAEADKKYAGNSIQAKFELLAGICELKSGLADAGKSRLKQISDDYPGSAYASKAADVLEAWVRLSTPAPSNTTDSGAAPGGNTGLWSKWDGVEPLIFIMSYQRGVNSNLIRAAINDYNKANFVFETLEVSPASAVGETMFLTVSGFSKSEVTQEYAKLMMGQGDMFASKGLYEYEIAWISQKNYSNLLKNNRIISYFEFFKTGNK
jgi:tetratricopeptide (TPR) repeat protein